MFSVASVCLCVYSVWALTLECLDVYVYMQVQVPPFYGSQCMCNSYNSYHRYTCTIKMLYFLNSFQYIVRTKISYLRSKKLPVSGSFAPRSPHQGPLDPHWGHSPKPHHLHPQYFAIPRKPRAFGYNPADRLTAVGAVTCDHKITADN